MRKKQNYCTVTYVAEYREDEDGYKLPIKNRVKVRKDGITRYCNCLHLLSKISARERMVLDYLCEQMECDNAIYITPAFKLKMIMFFMKNCGFTMKDQAVRSYLFKLSNLGLLINFQGKGTYVVNPKYYFKGTLQERNTLISSILNSLNIHPSKFSKKALRILLASDEGMF